jgi:hypothetical protein
VTGVLTLHNFRPVKVPLPAQTKQLTENSPGVSSVPTSPVQPYAADNAPPEAIPHGSLAALTDKLLWGRLDEFRAALSEAIELSVTYVSEDEAAPIDNQIFTYALKVLTPLFIKWEMPAPLVLPLQNGGIGVEWHVLGMNIELRFRYPYHIYAVIEDAHNAISPYSGRDPDLLLSQSALAELSARNRMSLQEHKAA